MNAYIMAAFSTHSAACLIFVGIPGILLACTQNAKNGFAVLAWLLGIFVLVGISSVAVGYYNYIVRRMTRALVLLESLIVLFAAGIGAAIPALWNTSRHDFISAGGWTIVYGIGPSLITCVFHYGKVKKLTEGKIAEPAPPESGGETPRP